MKNNNWALTEFKLTNCQIFQIRFFNCKIIFTMNYLKWHWNGICSIRTGDLKQTHLQNFKVYVFNDDYTSQARDCGKNKSRQWKCPFWWPFSSHKHFADLTGLTLFLKIPRDWNTLNFILVIIVTTKTRNDGSVLPKCPYRTRRIVNGLLCVCFNAKFLLLQVLFQLNLLVFSVKIIWL